VVEKEAERQRRREAEIGGGRDLGGGYAPPACEAESDKVVVERGAYRALLLPPLDKRKGKEAMVAFVSSARLGPVKEGRRKQGPRG
jgi:hypothetical protein